MNRLPFISCICVTCARTKHLEHAIHDFLKQDYNGPFQLIVYNTCPQQNLIYTNTNPDVIVLNCKNRPASLGAARNDAIRWSTGEIIVVYDDDDIRLPHHLSTVATAFQNTHPDRITSLHPERTELEWVWQSLQFWGWGDTIKEIVPGQCPCFAFTKKAWQEVGGYPVDLSVGEDRAFISKVTQKFPGAKVAVTGMPSFIYRWANQTYHMSGQGDDVPGKPRAYDRYWENVQLRFSTGQEPVGDISLLPHSDVDWPVLAAAFMEQELKKKPRRNTGMKDDVCIVELGRFGDIINVLPIAVHIQREYQAPHFMVSREFASVLDGVSYVKPHVVPLKNDQLKEAVALAHSLFKHVIVTQIWGKDWQQDRKTEAYNMESWRMAGLGQKFGNPAWKPVFDRRDKQREAALINKIMWNTKPVMLVQVTQSASSPLPKGDSMLEKIMRWFDRRYNIVNLANIHAHRIYDLLGLLENAHALVSIDTALLHLAAACDIPTVAITNASPWLGTKPRGVVPAHINYDMALVDEQLYASLQKVLAAPNTNNGHVNLPLLDQPVRKLFHCYEWHQETNPANAARKSFAQHSWQALYAQGVIPVPLDKYPRDSRALGEHRRLPFLKDCLMKAMLLAEDEDIIFWTNDDNWLHPELPEALRYHVSIYECCTSHRCEFTGRPIPAEPTEPKRIAEMGESHMGRDLFAFTKKWLREHWDLIGDFILGCSDFDLCIACMIRLHFGIESNRKNLEETIFPAELERGYVAHQYHQPVWGIPSYVHTAPGQVHNRATFKKWATMYAPHIKFHKHNVI